MAFLVKEMQTTANSLDYLISLFPMEARTFICTRENMLVTSLVACKEGQYPVDRIWSVHGCVSECEFIGQILLRVCECCIQCTI